MNKLLQLLAILVLSVCSISAYALSSVTEVETSIAKGDYDKAKEQLEDVIKAQPDSIVAHKYMLQVLDLEYAKTLTPSVEYKLYENNLNQINFKVAKAKADAVAEAERKASELRNRNAMIAFLVAITIAFGFMLGYVGFRFITRRIQYKREMEEAIKWKADAMADVLDINQLSAIMCKTDEEDSTHFSATDIRLLKELIKDNNDVLNCLNNDDYQPKLINQHIRNAYDFFNEMGVALP